MRRVPGVHFPLAARRILAGTSILDAWPSVRAMQGRARILGEEVVFNATRKWARKQLPKVNHHQIVLLNPDTNDFDGWIEHEPFTDFHNWGDRWPADADGTPIPYQQIRSANGMMPTPAVVFHAQVPAGGSKVVVVRDDIRKGDVPQPANTVCVDGPALTNRFVTLKLSDTGIAEITADGMSVLGERGLSLRLREDTADTWGFHIKSFSGAVTTTLTECAWRIDESGPLRARATAEALIGQSPVRLQVQLYADRADIDLRLDVRFCERFKPLQLPIHLRQSPPQWRCGLAGGAVDREPGATEWPLHGWSLTPGLAVFCHDANSASLNGDELAWSLARAVRQAWAGGAPELTGGHELSDQGALRFDIRLLCGEADSLGDKELHVRADRLVRPLVVFDRYEGMNRPPWGSRTPRHLWTASEHRARKDGRLADWVDDGQRAAEEPK